MSTTDSRLRGWLLAFLVHQAGVALALLQQTGRALEVAGTPGLTPAFGPGLSLLVLDLFGLGLLSYGIFLLFQSGNDFVPQYWTWVSLGGVGAMFLQWFLGLELSIITPQVPNLPTVDELVDGVAGFRLT